MNKVPNTSQETFSLFSEAPVWGGRGSQVDLCSFCFGRAVELTLKGETMPVCWGLPFSRAGGHPGE